MASVLNIDDAPFVDRWLNKSAALCDERQRGKDIDACDGVCCLLDSHDLICNPVADIHIKIVFQCGQLIFGAKDRFLKLFELRCDVALCVCQCLFSCIIIRHHILIRICDLKIITEYFVILNLHCLDAGFFALLGFQPCQP